MRFVNLTPHLIRLAGDGEEVELPSHGVARVSTTDQLVGNVGGFPVVKTSYGEVVGIPEAELGTIYIVSAMVLDRTDRQDVFAPDTGPTAIRKDGQIWAVHNLKIRS